MNDVVNAASAAKAPITIASGGTALLFVANPYVLYGVIAVLIVTCVAICIQIIWNCERRNQRLNALATRTARRAAANGCKCRTGSDQPSDNRD